jgi:hypothetical protein
MGEKCSVGSVKGGSMSKTELILKQTCPTCQSIYQLLEIYQQEKFNCSVNCFQVWQEKLHQYYQEKIILHLAQGEAQKERKEEHE